ncbi:MAG TPA: hypothetical protein VJI12_01520 [archaeon]|nr:hypothetical protein [archaeon]
MATIQISDELAETLSKRRIFDDESYEDVIWGLLESKMALSDKTKKRIEQSEKEIREGKAKSMKQVKKELGL